ncbi:hypothetical protein DYB25_003394 [Aphanomyces astaci]|uniref:DNA primase large subunit C-terminal domain-containing protein n=1 Tax=Aphanomyces astaci TaxID=112090 RepID=A0A397DLV0_APHAT|nr:hypothetical protein DYB25_003394 [Aphanomyces astaci]RHY64423.1 hypothetical protein DYB30_002455 [Aphanomyces astaci]
MLNVGNKSNARQQVQRRSAAHYRYALSMYQDAPVVEVTLEEFESYSIDRLHVLKTVEMHRVRGGNPRETEVKVDKALNMYLPMRTSEDREKDQLSHFILRMAFCHTEELRRWFLAHESYLFKHRLDRATREDKMHFMRTNGLIYEQVPGISTPSSNPRSIISCVHIGSRKVYLQGGIAYVPFDHLVSILYARFRSSLSKQLAVAFRKFGGSAASRDDRLMPVLKNLAKHHIGPDYSTAPVASGNAITAAMVDGLSKTSMPLCMKSLHLALTTQSHLKHGGRMQYGLFLKGMGLQLDDAIEFWRKEFCKKINVDDFNKKYAYNIRHNYGKEGKRKDYTPLNCMKIITSDPPKQGEYHGCPFRHFDEHHLRASLRGIGEIDKEAIVQLAKAKQYQVACKRHFEAMHPKANSDGVGNHPNAFFEESRKYFDSQPSNNNGVTPPNNTPATAVKSE